MRKSYNILGEPLVSIITPCYNGEKYVYRLLNSILSQTYNNIEFIFINDGSTDRTEEVVASYKDKFQEKGIKFIYIYQINKGQATALNQGLKIFKGKYLTWPDSDDFLSKDSIHDRVTYLETNSDYGFIRSNGSFVDGANLKMNRRVSNDNNRFDENIFEDLILEKTYCCCGCYMVRADAFLDIYPERQIFESRGGQNWQIIVPLASKFKCGYLDKDLYYIVEHADSHCRQVRSYKEQLQRVDDLENILLDALHRCRCDYNECKKVIRIRYTRIRLNTASEYHDIDFLNEQYRILKDNDCLIAKDKLIYYRGKNRLLDFICRVVFLPIRVLRKVKKVIKH